MTVGEFKQLVREMRAAQREYFRQRKKGMIPPGPSEPLEKAVELERQVDEAIAESDKRTSSEDLPRATCPDLFGGATGSTKPGHAQ